MQEAVYARTRRGDAAEVSILYLRCRPRRRGGGAPHQPGFNSLFEMQRPRPLLDGQGYICVSILYLRCEKEKGPGDGGRGKRFQFSI